MTCKCGREALDVKGAYRYILCGINCLFCDCPTPIDTPVPDTLVPIPHGLLLWSEGR